MDSVNPQASGSHSLGQLGVKLYRFRSLVRRNWWVLALTVGLGLAWQGWSLYHKPHLFSSKSELIIREAVDIANDPIKFQIESERFVSTALALLKNPEVLHRAEDRLKLEAPELTGERPEITPTRVGTSSIFSIVGQGKDPEYTRRFVDALGPAFIDYRIAKRGETLNEATNSIGGELKRLQTELTSQQAKLQEYKTKNNILFWSEQMKSTTEYLSGLVANQAALQTDLQRLEQLTPDQLLNSPPSMATPRGQGAAAVNDTAGPMGADLYSTYIQRSQELAQAQARYDERAKVWKPKHPRLQELKSQVDDLQRSIETIKQQNREACAQRKDAIRAELRSLEKSIADWTAKAKEASGKDGEYKQLEDNVKRVQDNFEHVRNSANPTDLSKGIDILTVLQPASPAVEVPINVTKQLLTGLLGGAAIGIALLLLLDRADDRMTSSSEMMAQFTEPILGQIPDVRDTRGAAGLSLLQLEDERYTFAEAFRSLRSSLIFMPNQEVLRTVLVTSAIPNEGKSTIASNLAITMAASGASVVLVDADLRRGDLASLFDTDGRTGLSNVLRGEAKWQDAAQTTKYPTLTLIPRGPVTSQSSELLLLPSVGKLLNELKDKFDLIVFNTAPILATDDTPTLSPHFDGTLMVIRAQFTSARLTKNALNALYQRQVNVLGLILNCVDTEMPDYYYYRYPKYYAAK